ncbi:MAG: phosphatidylserine/phosphatidylglycerophosphate/cardiolipin synthase family protein [Alphaproteobacteria bacterium]|nr:phosphatidylserine/phosphatidylglycerophosphate/cardiolipin synthase family protein [Alphaproteobacteria bacterium]
MTASYIPHAASGRYPARIGNLVYSLIDGEQIARRIGEAIGEARHSVWLTVAFYSDDFRFPDGLGSLFDVLDDAVARGLDVRLLVWRQNPETRPSHRIFSGSSEHRELLARRGSRFKIRWDKASGPFCQHQKSWVLDAGRPSEVAFVGGMNLTGMALTLHDVYLEIAGPAATDVRHNFVERWNEASERHAPDGNWACDASDELAYADRPSRPRGASTVQIQRMLDPRRYPAPRVERSILEQYQRAIDAARRTIFLQNQAVPDHEVARHLVAAVERGVDVVMLVPAIPEDYVYDARHDPREASRFWGIETLAGHENFTLAGITEQPAGRRRAAYVHAKMMLIDDVWATVGSCNLHPFSLAGHTEMNASIWDPAVARDLRGRLLVRHLGVDTADMDDRAALRLFHDLARANRRRLDRAEGDWRGAAFALSPDIYAMRSGLTVDLTWGAAGGAGRSLAQ